MKIKYSFPAAVAILWLAVMMNACAVFKAPSRPAAVPEPAYPEDLQIVTRSQWDWKALDKTLPEHTVSRITIHHGGEDFSETQDPVLYLRNLQAWSRSAEKNWMDIPYHYMIDLAGTIYEARPLNYPGDTNTAYDPTGHALICVMGNYEHQVLNARQLAALVQLTAFLAGRYAVPGANIKGHKDYAETLCPGKDLYRYLQDGTFQELVRQRLGR